MLRRRVARRSPEQVSGARTDDAASAPAGQATASADDAAELAQVNALYSMLEDRYSKKVGWAITESFALECEPRTDKHGSILSRNPIYARSPIQTTTPIFWRSWMRRRGDRGWRRGSIGGRVSFGCRENVDSVRVRILALIQWRPGRM